MTNEQPDLLCPRDAGRILGLTTSGVIRLARLGQLPELRDSGNRRLFLRADVERVASRRRDSPPKRVTVGRF